MKYKNYIEKITTELSRHRSDVDKVKDIYNAELSGHKQQVENMRKIYKEEFIEEYHKNWSPKVDYENCIKNSSKKAYLECEFYLDKIKAEMDKFFNTPIRKEYADKIQSISGSGMVLKDREIEMLLKDATNYLELRLLEPLAESRTRQTTVSSINEQGYTETKQVEVKNPYFLHIPDIDNAYRNFDDFSSSVRQMAKFYCGDNAELKSFLGDISEFAPLTANSYFKNNAAGRFTSTMEEISSCLPERKVKTSLTESEKKLIDTLIDCRYPILAENRVRALAEADSDIAELLSLDERYKGFIKTEE